MKIYLARPISGCTKNDVLGYYRKMNTLFTDLGLDVLCPMTGKANLRVNKEYRAEYSLKEYGEPIITNHSIFNRDKWMVQQSDIVFTNLIGAKSVSVGCVVELAWADAFGKYTVLAMENKNPHRHAFIIELGHTIFTNEEDAVAYIVQLAKKEL